MKQAIKLGLLALAAFLFSYAGWRWFMAGRVAQVNATIAYHNQQLKASTPTMVLKAEEVAATGYPFHFRVKINKLILSMIEGEETFLVATGPIEIGKERLGATVATPSEFTALYAKNGTAPEEYHASMSERPEIILTHGAEEHAADVPFTHFRMLLPKSITLNMTLGEQTKPARFDMPPSNIMIEHKIPNNLQHPLWLLVSVMREALVYGTPSQQ